MQPILTRVPWNSRVSPKATRGSLSCQIGLWIQRHLAEHQRSFSFSHLWYIFLARGFHIPKVYFVGSSGVKRLRNVGLVLPAQRRQCDQSLTRMEQKHIQTLKYGNLIEMFQKPGREFKGLCGWAFVFFLMAFLPTDIYKNAKAAEAGQIQGNTHQSP